MASSNPKYRYRESFPLGKDETRYRLLTRDHVAVEKIGDREILRVDPQALTLLARQAFQDVNFLLRSAHLAKLKAILDDPEASDNDRFVATTLLKNAVIAAQGQLPSCQDTGTAIVIGGKGQAVWTGCDDEAALEEGIFRTYQD